MVKKNETRTRHELHKARQIERRAAHRAKRRAVAFFGGVA